MLKIGGKVDGSLKTACSTADKNLAALGKTAKTAGKIAAGAMVAAATAVATLGTAAVKSAAEYEAQLANVSTLLTGTELKQPPLVVLAMQLAPTLAEALPTRDLPLLLGWQPPADS